MARRAGPSSATSRAEALRRLRFRRLPELVDVLDDVEHRVLKLAADLVHAADVGRDDRVLLLVEAEGPARRLEAHLAERRQEARLVLDIRVDGLHRLSARLRREVAEVVVVDGILPELLVERLDEALVLPGVEHG